MTPDRLLALGSAFKASKVLLSAMELGVFSVLAKGPRDLETLRLQVGISERCARDFFDCLVSLQLIERDAGGNYSNTPDADLYLDGAKPTYIGGEFDHLNLRAFPQWQQLTITLRTGGAQGRKEADDYFPELYRDRASLTTFARGMTANAVLVAPALGAKFPWHEVRTLTDIGTAQGCLPVQLALAHPHLTGVGFDLPELGPLFDDYVRQHGLSDRLRFQGGDFLRQSLPSADVVILGRVLHNWNLETKKMLLAKAYEALPFGGAVIVYERLIDDERRLGSSALLASLNMALMTTGGFDFTGADCISWMDEAGFHDFRVQELAAQHSMVIGVK